MLNLNCYQDPSAEDSGLKSRLVIRDQGCVVCMVLKKDDDALYLFPDVDSMHFMGAHIFPLQYNDLVR